MLKKFALTTALSFSVLLLLFSSASAAISFSYSEGVWGRVDDGYDGIVFDVVGVIGQDPGDAWSSGLKSTQNQTLTRNATVCTHDPDGDATLGEWSGGAGAFYTGLGSHTFGPGACELQGLFISEYIEAIGDNNNNHGNDAIEIYNNLGQAVDLSPFFIQIYNGGSTTPSVTIPLKGMITDNLLANHTTLVIARTSVSGVPGWAVTRSALGFSGNDAVALVRDYLDDTGNPGPDGQVDGATGLQYATGPTGLNPTATGWTVVDRLGQNGPTGDWNQIRYGSPTNFGNKSGLAFQGVTNDESFQVNNAFLAGKFCHVNNPISASNSFVNTNLTLDLYNIDCGDYKRAPYPPQKISFVYPVTLDETSNSGTCQYPSTSPCADAVTLGEAQARFTCFYSGDVQNTYTVAIMGFMDVGVDQDCSEITYDPNLIEGIFISDEGTTNCGCLFAMVTDSHPSAVELISFNAESTPEGVKITWETATETDNLGFNLYRSDSLTSDKVQLNDTLIQPNVAPGSPFGATYEFVDTGAAGLQTYFYWLEDIDASGVITLHGPVIVIRQ